MFELIWFAAGTTGNFYMYMQPLKMLMKIHNPLITTLLLLFYFPLFKLNNFFSFFFFEQTSEIIDDYLSLPAGWLCLQTCHKAVILATITVFTKVTWGSMESSFTRNLESTEKWRILISQTRYSR